jgi:signal recognition particle subunit SRP54
MKENDAASGKMLSGHFRGKFCRSIKQVQKCPMRQILEMLPGNLGKVAKQVDPNEAEKSLKMTEAILSSMTAKERLNPDLLNASRKRRIASGSGTEVQDVNKLLKQYRDAQKMMKTLQKTVEGSFQSVPLILISLMN